MKIRTKAIAAILIVALASCAVYAAIVVQKQISTQIQIMAAYDMEILDIDEKTPLMTVDFGSHYRGEEFKVPEAQKYSIKNTGEGDIWLSFDVVDWPENVQIWLQCWVSNYWADNIANPGDISISPLPPGQIMGFNFNIKITSTASFGSYTPTITFTAYDTATG